MDYLKFAVEHLATIDKDIETEKALRKSENEEVNKDDLQLINLEVGSEKADEGEQTEEEQEEENVEMME